MSFWAFSYFRQISDFRFSREIFASLVRFIYVYSRSDDYVEWVDGWTRLLIPHSRLIWSIHRWIKTETNIFSDKTNIFWSTFIFYCIFAGNPEFRPSGNPPPPGHDRYPTPTVRGITFDRTLTPNCMYTPPPQRGIGVRGISINLRKFPTKLI